MKVYARNEGFRVEMKTQIQNDDIKQKWIPRIENEGPEIKMKVYAGKKVLGSK